MRAIEAGGHDHRARVLHGESLLLGGRQLKKGVYATPVPPTRKLAQIAVEDIAAVAVRILEDRPRHVGKRYDIAGEELTGEDCARILSTIAGRPFQYVQVPLDVIRKAMGDDRARMYAWFEATGYSFDPHSAHKRISRRALDLFRDLGEAPPAGRALRWIGVAHPPDRTTKELRQLGRGELVLIVRRSGFSDEPRGENRLLGFDPGRPAAARACESHGPPVAGKCPGRPHRLKRRRRREVLLRLLVIKLMVRGHGLEAIRHLRAAQRLAQRVHVRRVAMDQHVGDALRVGERTGREYAIEVRLNDPVSAQDARSRCMGNQGLGEDPEDPQVVIEHEQGETRGNHPTTHLRRRRYRSGDAEQPEQLGIGVQSRYDAADITRR